MFRYPEGGFGALFNTNVIFTRKLILFYRYSGCRQVNVDRNDTQIESFTKMANNGDGVTGASESIASDTSREISVLESPCNRGLGSRLGAESGNFRLRIIDLTLFRVANRVCLLVDPNSRTSDNSGNATSCNFEFKLIVGQLVSRQ